MPDEFDALAQQLREAKIGDRGLFQLSTWIADAGNRYGGRLVVDSPRGKDGFTEIEYRGSSK